VIIRKEKISLWASKSPLDTFENRNKVTEVNKISIHFSMNSDFSEFAIARLNNFFTYVREY